MAMERFLVSLVFCEMPGIDVVDFAGTSVTAAVKASTAGRAEAPPAEAKKEDGGRKERFSGEAAYEPAFDGLNCFETIVMRR
uniref:Uncharacterized protein n=1 Tax=Oryza brachyantha TaxID=4533 RepID=J3MB06_ORYBR